MQEIRSACSRESVKFLGGQRKVHSKDSMKGTRRGGSRGWGGEGREVEDGEGRGSR